MCIFSPRSHSRWFSRWSHYFQSDRQRSLGNVTTLHRASSSTRRLLESSHGTRRRKKKENRRSLQVNNNLNYYCNIFTIFILYLLWQRSQRSVTTGSDIFTPRTRPWGEFWLCLFNRFKITLRIMELFLLNYHCAFNWKVFNLLIRWLWL